MLKLFTGSGWNLPLRVNTSVAKDSGGLFSPLQTVIETGVNRGEFFWGLRRKPGSRVFHLQEVPAFLASLAVPSGVFSQDAGQ